MCARECSLISVCMHVSVEECGECVHSSSGCCVFQYFALVAMACRIVPGKNLHKERYIGET